MTIIDEMRREAGNAERSGHTYEALFMTEWADRLAASGALVPVPDGEACWLDDAGSEAVVYYDSVTDSKFLLIRTGSGMFHLTGEKVDLGKDAPVLPVRLVPIAEAEI